MKNLSFQIIILFLSSILLLSGLTIGEFNQDFIVNENIELTSQSDDFYFVQLTDTHIMHKIYDRYEKTRQRLTSVLEHVISFEPKPAFIVITGDLVEWGGSGITGALNCIAFVNCFYENEDQLYADEDFTIPVYTTPGNHGYCFNRNLKNYQRFIDKNHVDDKNRYNITYNGVKLFFMDSGPNHYAHPKYWDDILGDGLYNCDIEWIESKLINCTAEKKIILMHHPAINKRKDNGDMGGVIYQNREVFVDLCETYNVDLVLAGHTHNSRVMDSSETIYNVYPINSSQYSTLYVQSDDCKQGVHYRNISIIGNDIWIGDNEELNITYIGNQDDNLLIDSYLDIIFRRMYREKI
jgi:predicted MPP superfamily phosphohydrolase